MSLKEWARLQGIHPQTMYRWFGDGMLPVPAVRVNARPVLVAPDEVDDDLVRDVTGVLTSSCARRYGRRPARNRAENALRYTVRETGPASPQAAR